MPRETILLTILPVTWPHMPPVGLGYLQAFLSQKDIHADLIDFNHLFYTLSDQQLQKQWLVSCNTFYEENILSLIQQRHFKEFQDAVERMLTYGTVGFSCFKSNFKTTLSIAGILKSKKDTIKIVLGGPEITRQYFREKGNLSQELLQRADYLIVGEGEIPLYQYLIDNSTCKKIAAFRQLDDLTGLPFPRYTGINMNAYPRKNTVPIQFSRGCIRRCNFCSERLLYKNFRTRPASSLMEEIQYHKINNKTQYFVFYDSLINADLKKLHALCDGIIERFGSIHWEAQIAIRNDMNEKLFEKMRQSGCYSLFVGLESGSDDTLKNMNKGFSAEAAINFFIKLHTAGIFFGVSIIVGYPGETDQDFQNTVDFIIRHKSMIPQIAQINPFTYYDGTSANETADYRVNPTAIKRMDILVHEIKRYKIKHTNAFIGNLIEKCVP
ncbi:MAG: radical SAM protein [Candidatus Brocadia sp.]|uniref:Oxidoreductase n=1 Tax=Candidatus Brocadia fulgida TaxID=380242 RepID=A0A0M2USQ0_9BACT|nr:MAG: oxidoreductase [Candidatus Brocadia fulgida]UJS21241.1 MAG: radical SAM protein [Candidatus Brocadia sp.]